MEKTFIDLKACGKYELTCLYTLTLAYFTTVLNFMACHLLQFTYIIYNDFKAVNVLRYSCIKYSNAKKAISI